MSPHKAGGINDPVSGAESIGPLLDSTFGLGVWAAHFLVVYGATAVACQLGLRDAGVVRSTFHMALNLVTLVATTIVLFHARRRQQRRQDPDTDFRVWVTIGCDAVAAVAIAWQLFALLLVPLCT